MSALDNIDNTDVYDNNCVEPDPVLKVNFVFKRDLNNTQIAALKARLGDHDLWDAKSNTITFKEEVEDAWVFLDTAIPCELADMLSYVKCFWTGISNSEPIMLFKSNVMLKRGRLISSIGMKVREHRGLPSQQSKYIPLKDILFPTGYGQSEFLRLFDFPSIERIASHFFFNPKVLSSPLRDKRYAKHTPIKMKDVLVALNSAQKIIMTDASQKITIPPDESFIDYILGQKEIKVRVYEVADRIVNKETRYNLFLVARAKRSGYEPADYHILAFVNQQDPESQLNPG